MPDRALDRVPGGGDPDIAMSDPKELNFFNGPDEPPHDDPDTWWLTGQWHRGLEWYAGQLGSRAPVRGESSPAYTSPSFPEVARRMASVVPDVRLLYLVRDPVDRAVSQYAHHRRDGAETRPAAEALLDPGSQYVARSRYVERLEPFLAHFDREQIRVVVQERLLHDRTSEMAEVYRHVGVDPGWRGERLKREFHVGGDGPQLDRCLRRAVLEQVRDDVERLEELLDDDLKEWETA